MMAPKDFARISRVRTGYMTRSCGADSENYMPVKDYSTIEECFSEMNEWAKSGIWYAHLLNPLSENLKLQLTELGFNVYEYFGATGIGWQNARFGGMVKFEANKHLLTLESEDILCGSLFSESLNFYMYNKTHAIIGNGHGTISVIEEFINGNLRIDTIQKKSYWNEVIDIIALTPPPQTLTE